MDRNAYIPKCCRRINRTSATCEVCFTPEANWSWFTFLRLVHSLHYTVRF